MSTGVFGPSTPPAAAAPMPPTTPVTDHCPHRVHTPPAVDESEVVAPGSPTPTPLPVPAPPVGGAQLADCGVVVDPTAGPVPPALTSAGWLVADLDSGAVLAAKDPHGRYRPASTVKVLLALVVLDELGLDTVITPTVEEWSTEGDSCGMGPGGRYSNRDLLTGLLVVSGNDCAGALARQLGGVEATLAKMNTTARSLGALDTRAASPSGLDAPGMSSSPYDLALIFREAMSDSIFRSILALENYRFPGYPRRSDVPGDEDHPPYLMHSSNHLLLEGYPGMVGGKTGYTDDARKTYVGVTERDGRRILVVEMFGLTVGTNSYWDQTKALFDYGFRTPSSAAVGKLATRTAAVTTSPASSAPTTTPTAAARTVAAAGTDQPTGWSIRILIGLIAALAAVILLLVALRLFAKR
ncbi:serine hydrolase [Gordonia mangrovi]|nr:serine hydrolase [Gordonia mangrovi]UVF80827.1 serine hydrolase [Gordonia mangrovi]